MKMHHFIILGLPWFVTRYGSVAEAAFDAWPGKG